MNSLSIKPTSQRQAGFFSKSPLSNAQLVMMLCLFSWGMLFGTLIFSLMLARMRSVTWPPIGITPLDPTLPAFSTVLLFLSSFFLHKGYRHFRENTLSGFKSFWGMACFSGALFVALQVVTLVQWWNTGTTHEAHLYTSCLYVFIIFHALHVLIGLGGLLYKYFKPVNQQSLQMWGWFWHFIDIVWVVSFPILVF